MNSRLSDQLAMTADKLRGAKRVRKVSLLDRIRCWFKHQWVLVHEPYLITNGGPTCIEVIWYKQRCARCDKQGSTVGAKIFVNVWNKSQQFEVGTIQEPQR